MKSAQGRLILMLVVGSSALAGIALAVAAFSGKTLPDAVWYLIPGYALMTLLLYRIVAGAGKKSPHRFVAAVNGSVTIKLLVTAATAGVYFMAGMPHRKAFALALLGIYLVFTAILIAALLPELRKPSGQ